MKFYFWAFFENLPRKFNFLVFFLCVIPRCVNFICRRFGTLCSIFIVRVNKKNAGNQPKERIQIHDMGKVWNQIQVLLQSDNNTDTLHKDQYTFLIISRSVLLRMRNFSDKSCSENKNKHFCVIFFNCAFNEMMWRNTVGSERPQMTIRRTRTSRWIPKATDLP